MFDGHVTLLAFIYTSCNDVNGCPLATFVMGQMAKRLQRDPAIGDALRLVSYSFDIAHDTPAVLEKYAQSFRPEGARWDFVTAPDKAVLERTL
ncbi:MAG: SCO family protein, partial [Gammaproteobacteria bacterium]